MLVLVFLALAALLSHGPTATTRSHAAPGAPVAGAATPAGPARNDSSAKPADPRTIPIRGGTAKERAAVRAMVKKWGQHTQLTSITLRKGLGRYGVARLWPTGKSTIELRSGLGRGLLKYTVAHELAHAAQAHAYRNAGFDALRTQMNAVFGGTGLRGVENGADCAAQLLTKKKSTVYKSTCTKQQLAAAARFLAGSTIR